MMIRQQAGLDLLENFERSKLAVQRALPRRSIYCELIVSRSMSPLNIPG